MTNQEMNTKKAQMEAILFTMGTSVPQEVIQDALACTEEEVEDIAAALSQKYDSEDSGIRIIRLDDAYQLCTKTEYYDVLIKVATTPFRPVLTEVLLEVLSIVAYKQPVTRGEIERIRGVSSDYAVNRLIEYGLIEECGRQDAPGRPILFGTTEDFLRKFGLSSTDELPEISQELLEEAAHEAMENAHFVMEGQQVLPLFGMEEPETESTNAVENEKSSETNDENT